MSLDSDSKWFQYTIQPGNSVGELVEQYHITSEAIQAANPGIDINNLQVGAVISIPADPAIVIGQTGPSGRPERGPSQGPGREPGGGPERRPGRGPEFPPRRGPGFYRPYRPYRPYYRPYRRPYYPYEPAYPYPACPAGARPYIIEPGDTLYQISNRFGLSPEEIINFNPYLNFQGPLPIGETICLPV